MKPPAFQFYADDFLAGVADMTQAEVGAYILLLCHQWSRGSVPSDPARAALIAKGEVTDHVISKFPGGKNKRMESVRKISEEWAKKQAANGRMGAAKRWHGDPIGPAMATPMARNSSPSPSPSPILLNEDSLNDKPTKPKRSAVASPASDSEWLDGLAKNEAYQGVNVRTEFAKMQAWCSENRKTPSRRRFVNWLNRADRPVSPQANYSAPKPDNAPANWRVTLLKLYPDARQDMTWAELPRSVKDRIEDQELFNA